MNICYKSLYKQQIRNCPLNNKPIWGNQELQQLLDTTHFTQTPLLNSIFSSVLHIKFLQICVLAHILNQATTCINIPFSVWFLNWSRNVSKLPTFCCRKIIFWEKRYTIQRARIPFGKSKIRYNYWALPFSCQTYNKFSVTANSNNMIQFIHPPSPSLCPQVLHCKLSYNPILLTVQRTRPFLFSNSTPH